MGPDVTLGRKKKIDVDLIFVYGRAVLLCFLGGRCCVRNLVLK